MALLLNCFFLLLLLLLACGADETVNTPLAENGTPDVAPAPTWSPYFPITLDNRWTYRNPDGSEWSRYVAESEVFDAERYHSFSYNPPMALDFIGPAEYITYTDRLVRLIKAADYTEAIWQIILDSGGETPGWYMELHCEQVDGEIIKDTCKLVKDLDIFDPPDMLTLLYSAWHRPFFDLRPRPLLRWQSELTPLRFPLLPSKSYTALEFRLRSKSVIMSRWWEFYADVKIFATIGNALELVETSAGTFQDCLKIQYETGPISIQTLKFEDTQPPLILDLSEELKAFELALHDELTDVLNHLMPKLGLQTMWFAPGVGPVKIETPNGIAELIGYEIKAVDLYRTR